MSVTREEVDRIAGLARLELGEEGEAESLRRDLNGILQHMETLEDAPVTEEGDAGAVEGSAEAHREGAAPLREDGEASPDPLRRSLEQIAPGWEDGFFSVPRLPGLEDESTP